MSTAQEILLKQEMVAPALELTRQRLNEVIGNMMLTCIPALDGDYYAVIHPKTWKLLEGQLRRDRNRRWKRRAYLARRRGNGPQVG